MINAPRGSNGQCGYKGHVINLPQTFATSLPRIPKELDVLIIRENGSDNTHIEISKIEFIDFKVRREVMLKALLRLKQHNKYYRKVNINVVDFHCYYISTNSIFLA